jgi:hypothetical protein
VLKTGIAWEDLPAEAFGCSYKTCKRRLEVWAALGLWSRLHRLFLARLRAADWLDWSRVLIDTSSVKGVPLVVQVAAANTLDVRTAVPLVVGVPPVAGKPGLAPAPPP